MTTANILSVEKQGRHRYFKFASDEVAQAIESIAGLITLNESYKRVKRPKVTDFTYARTCYDHLAGYLGVKITKSLLNSNIIAISGKDYKVTTSGKEWFDSLDIDINSVQQQKRSFAHQCLDWSEREHHIAGALGSSFLEMMIKKDWVRRKSNSRELLLTSKGKIELKIRLNLDI